MCQESYTHACGLCNHDQMLVCVTVIAIPTHVGCINVMAMIDRAVSFQSPLMWAVSITKWGLCEL